MSIEMPQGAQPHLPTRPGGKRPKKPKKPKKPLKPIAKVILLIFMPFILAIFGYIGTQFMQSGQRLIPSKGEVDKMAIKAIDDFRFNYSNADTILRNAKAILVFPSVKSGGIVLGGKYSKGALKEVNATVIDDELFLSFDKTLATYEMKGGSLGLQFGYQSRTNIVIFLDQHALVKFKQSLATGIYVGIDMSLAVGEQGASKYINFFGTDKSFVMYQYNNHGLMYTFDLDFFQLKKVYQ